MEGYPPPHLQYPNQQQMWANFYNSGGGGVPEDHHNGGRYHGAMSPHMIGGGGPMEAWWQGGSGPIPGDPSGYRLPGLPPVMHPGAPGPWAMRGRGSRNDRRGPGRPRMAKGDRPEPGTSPFYPNSEGMTPEMLANVGSPGEMKRGPGRPKSMMETGGPKMPDTTKNGNKKRYTCEVCQKRFSTAWYVRVHRRSHNGERPYVCNNCGKGFMLPNVLQVHLRKCEKNNPPGAGSSTTPGGQPGNHPGEAGGPPDQSPIHPGSGPGMGVGGGVPGGPSGLPPSTSYGFVEAGGGPGGHLPPHSQPHQIQGMGAFNQRYIGDMTPPHMSGHQPPYPAPHGMEMGQPPYGVPGVVGPDRYPHHPGLDGHSPNQFSPLYSPNSGGSGGMPPISSATNSESSNSEHHFLAIDKPRDKGGGLDSMMIPSPASSSGGSGGDHASAFIRHPSQAGSGTNQTNYCNACDQRFEDKAATEEHMKTHRPFPCEICDRRFSQKCNLVTHLRLHTGEKPYACDFCDKRFTQKGNLDAHIKTHTKEKPFQCTLCNKKFSFKSSLQTHMRNHEAGTLSLDVDEDDIETLKQHARMMNQQAQIDSDSNLASGTPPTDYSGGEDGGVSGAGGGSLPPSPGSGHHLHTEYGATVQLQNHQLYSGSITSGGTSGPDADISKLTSTDSRQTVAML